MFFSHKNLLCHKIFVQHNKNAENGLRNIVVGSKLYTDFYKQFLLENRNFFSVSLTA